VELGNKSSKTVLRDCSNANSEYIFVYFYSRDIQNNGHGIYEQKPLGGWGVRGGDIRDLLRYCGIPASDLFGQA